ALLRTQSSRHHIDDTSGSQRKAQRVAYRGARIKPKAKWFGKGRIIGERLHLREILDHSEFVRKQRFIAERPISGRGDTVESNPRFEPLLLLRNEREHGGRKSVVEAKR